MALDITKEELAELIGSSVGIAVTQAISEHRTETPAPSAFTCICANHEDRKRHEDEHEALRRIMKLLDRVETARWKLWGVVAGLILIAVCYAAFEGAKIYIKG